MNVTFTLADREREPEFLAGAEARGLVGLKGHRSIGGVRASIYNSVELDSVEELVRFLDQFRLERYLA